MKRVIIFVLFAFLVGSTCIAGCQKSNSLSVNTLAEEVEEETVEEYNSFDQISNDYLLPLHAACNSDKIDIELVKKLADEGADLNEEIYIDKAKTIRMTPLMMACNRSNIDIDGVSQLIELGADVNKRSFGKTPLMIACNRNNIDVKAIRFLVESGAKINVRDYQEKSALMFACNHSDIDDEAIQTLIELGADVNLVDNDEKNAAMIAADRVNPDLPVLEMLMNSGTDVNHLDEDGKNILMYPGVLRSLKLTQHIIDMGGNIHIVATGDNEDDLLGSAAAFGTKEVVQFYLNKGMNVNRRRKDGQTPVMLAAWGNTLDVVKLLVDAGADLSITAYDGFTVLMSACSQKRGVILIDRAQANVVEYLLKSGANVKEEEKYGQTVMSYIVMNKKDVRGVVDLLLKYGADLNHRSKEGITPLDWATNPDVTKYIISKGANVHTQTDDLYTPLHYAVKNDKLDAAQVLLDAGIDRDAKISPTKDVRMLANSPKAVDFLYQNGYRFNDIWANITDYKAILSGLDKDADRAKRFAALLKAGIGSDNSKFEEEVLKYFCTHSLEPLYVDDILDALIQRKPDLLNGINGSLYLYTASQGDSAGLVTALSRHGAKLGAEVSPFKSIFKNEASLNREKMTNMIKALIAAGAYINERVDAFDKWQVIVQGIHREPVYRLNVPVLCLIAERYPEALKDALNAGADPNVVCNSDGSTPIMQVKDFYAIKALIKAGADINAQRTDHKTVLMIHAESGTPDTVKALLDAGAKIDKASFAKARFRWDTKPMIENYLNGKRYSATNLVYLQNYTEEMIKDFVDHGGDINQRVNNDGETLLFNACLHELNNKEDEQKVKLLLKYGADPNLGPTQGGLYKGETPLLLLSHDSTPNFNIIKMLIDAGADVNAQLTETGTTALMYATMHKNLPLIKLLLDKGADVLKVDSFDENVLLKLDNIGKNQESVSLEILDLLLKYGADVHKKDEDGNTALMKQCHEKND